MKKLLLIVMLLPFRVKSQGNGIKFEYGLNWQEIRDKARKENKFILLDCYTTWCGPCKRMDLEVYPDTEVGVFVNSNFISVKVQMDSSAKDTPETMKWYSDAHVIQQQYKISAYPTFFFFSPSGSIVHKGVGYLNPNDFISLAKNALDSSRQYFTLIENYQNGKKDYLNMSELAINAKKYGQDSISNAIALYYKNKFLAISDDQVICKKENLDFIAAFYYLIDSRDNYFKLFYLHPEIPDTVMHFPGFSRQFVDIVIKKEEITDKLWSHNKPVTRLPNWAKITTDITKKYGEAYSDRLVLPAQLEFYKQIDDWPKYASIVENVMKQCPPKINGQDFGRKSSLGFMGLNNDDWALNYGAWDVFQHCTDKSVLLKAVKWSDLSIQLVKPEFSTQYIDTKANLLFKLGQVQKAIACEKKAIEIEKTLRKEDGNEGSLLPLYTKTVAKMEKGEPTW